MHKLKRIWVIFNGFIKRKARLTWEAAICEPETKSLLHILTSASVDLCIYVPASTNRGDLQWGGWQLQQVSRCSWQICCLQKEHDLLVFIKVCVCLGVCVCITSLYLRMSWSVVWLWLLCRQITLCHSLCMLICCLLWRGFRIERL